MSGYDGPSFFKHQPSEIGERSLFNLSDKSDKRSSSKGGEYQLPDHTSKSIFINKNQSSIPFRLHTVPSTYFSSHKTKKGKRTNYAELKKKLKKTEEEFLLFDAFLSKKGEKLWKKPNEGYPELPQNEKEASTLTESKTRLVKTTRKRLSQSLAGIIEAEKSNESRTKNIDSLFSNTREL